MAKAKIATRKKGSKRRKASAKVERKSAAKRSHGEKGKVEGSACRRSCSQIHDKKTAGTKSCGNRGFKENAEPSGRGAGRRHDHRRDRGARPWRGRRH